MHITLMLSLCMQLIWLVCTVGFSFLPIYKYASLYRKKLHHSIAKYQYAESMTNSRQSPENKTVIEQLKEVTRLVDEYYLHRHKLPPLYRVISANINEINTHSVCHVTIHVVILCNIALYSLQI